MGKTATYLQFKDKGTGELADPKLVNAVTQFAHFGAWYFLMTLCATVSNRLFHQPWAGVVVGGVFNILYALWQGFFWKKNAARGSGLEDFGFLLLGGFVGALAYAFLMR